MDDGSGADKVLAVGRWREDVPSRPGDFLGPFGGRGGLPVGGPRATERMSAARWRGGRGGREGGGGRREDLPDGRHRPPSRDSRFTNPGAYVLSYQKGLCAHGGWVWNAPRKPLPPQTTRRGIRLDVITVEERWFCSGWGSGVACVVVVVVVAVPVPPATYKYIRRRAKTGYWPRYTYVLYRRHSLSAAESTRPRPPPSPAWDTQIDRQTDCMRPDLSVCLRRAFSRARGVLGLCLSRSLQDPVQNSRRSLALPLFLLLARTSPRPAPPSPYR